MKRIALLVVVTAAVAWPATPAGAATDCGFVAFIPNSDSGAFNIRATGVTCRTARSVARASKGSPKRYRHRHFRCRGRDINTSLPSTRFRCTRGDALVTFNRS